MVFLILVFYTSSSIIFGILEGLFRVFWYSTTPLADPDKSHAFSPAFGTVACVASVSVRFRRKERGTRVKDREKSGASKTRFISRGVKTESPLPRYFFAPKPNGNACYAGYWYG